MDPNTWAIISVVIAAVALNHTMLSRTLRSEVNRLDQMIDVKIDGVERKIDGVEKQLTDKIDGVDGKAETRADSLGDVLRVQFGAIDKRLGAIEDDMLLVKAHLLGVDRAS